MPNFLKRHENTLAPLLFTLAALALYLWGLGEKSLWGDEALTAWHSTIPLKQLWFDPVTNKPPLYYLITSLFWTPGDSEFLLRLPAAIFGAATVGLSWLFGNKLAGSRGGFWLALFMLLADMHLHYSQEARQYMLLAFAWLILLLAMLRTLEYRLHRPTPAARDLLLWAVGAVLMVQTHPVALIYLASSQLAFWIALATSGTRKWQWYFLPFLVTTLSAATLAPWLLTALQTPAASFEWLQQPSPLSALIQWISLAGGRNLVFLGGKALALGASIALAGLSLVGAVLFMRRKATQATLILALTVLTPLILWLTGLIKPVYIVRTISPLHLLIMTGLMLMVTSLRKPTQQMALGLAIAAVLALSSWQWRLHYQKEAWRDLTITLQQQLAANDVILICESNLHRPLWFYMGNAFPLLLDLDRHSKRVLAWDSEQRRWRLFRPLPNQAPPTRFWVIDRYQHCPENMGQVLYQLTGLRYLHDLRWQGHALTLTEWTLSGTMQREGLPRIRK